MLFRMILLARLVSFGKDFRRDFKHCTWTRKPIISDLLSTLYFVAFPCSPLAPISQYALPDMLFRMILLARLVSFGKDFRRDFKHFAWRLGSRLSAICSQPCISWLSLADPSHLFRSRLSQACSFE